MNYRHAFHAGNHADVLKHLALLVCLERLKAKPAPFAVLDTHAGAGLYDLAGEAAERSPEWRGGIGRLWDWSGAPAPVAALVDAVKAVNPDGNLRFYPGSPALIAAALRPHDRLAACELHPEEAEALRTELRGASNAQVHARDGWEALGALLPPAERRGLVLIDPPYEALGELGRAARALGPALQRFGHGIFLWWRPLKSGAALDRADAEAAAQGAKNVLRADLWLEPPQLDGKLTGSSLFIVNPPFGLEATLREALPALAEQLGGERGGWRIA